MLIAFIKSIFNNKIKLISAIIIVGIGFFLGASIFRPSLQKESQNLDMLNSSSYGFAGIHNNVKNENGEYIFDNLYLYPSFSFKLYLREGNDYQLLNSDIAMEILKVEYTKSNYINSNNINSGEYEKLQDDEIAVSQNLADSVNLKVGDKLYVNYLRNEKRELKIKYIYKASFGFMNIDTNKGLSTAILGEYYEYVSAFPAAKYLNFSDNKNSLIYNKIEYKNTEIFKSVLRIIIAVVCQAVIASIFCFIQEAFWGEKILKTNRLKLYLMSRKKLFLYTLIPILTVIGCGYFTSIAAMIVAWFIYKASFLYVFYSSIFSLVFAVLMALIFTKIRLSVSRRYA